MQKTLDTFDFTFQPKLDKESVLPLFTHSFIREKENIIFVGPSGVGKTHLATTPGVSACQNGYTCYFMSFQHHIKHLRRTEEGNRVRRKLMTFCKPHVLIIDELGYLPLDRSDANLFFNWFQFAMKRDLLS